MRFLLLSLLILSTAAVGGTRVAPNTGSNMSILTSSNTGYLSGTNYWKQGDTVTSYIERLGRHTPVGVTPSRGVPTSRIAGAAKDLLRLSPHVVASSLAFGALLEGVGWAIDELTGQITATEETVADYQEGHFGWCITPGSACTHLSALYASPDLACAQYDGLYGDGNPAVLTMISATQGTCRAAPASGSGSVTQTVARTGSSCPAGTTYSTSRNACVGTITRPVDQSEIDTLPVAGDASFYDGLMRDACSLSASPARCFDDLVEQRMLAGPSTVQGPKTTTTSTQTNADGSTSTVEKEVSTQYEIQYGDDHYVYTPKTTTETKVNGQTTETTVEKEDTAEDSEQKPEEEEAVSEIAGLQCEAAIACSGDAIQCAIASTQKDTKCLLQESLDFPTQQSEITSIFQGDDFVLDEEEIDIPSFIGQGSRFLPSTCPAPISLPLSGKTLQLDTQPFCTFANDLSFLIVAFATLASALYVGRAFGGE